MSVIGVDYDSYKATLCAIEHRLDDHPRFAVAQFRRTSATGEDSAVLSLGNVTRALVGALREVTDEHSNHAIWIERGFGMSRKADWILGAYFGAIWSSLFEVIRAGDALNKLDLREWKKIVTADARIGLTKKGEGNGNAKKEVANEACRALLETVGASSEGLSPDHLDSWGCAYAGRALNLRALERQEAA